MKRLSDFVILAIQVLLGYSLLHYSGDITNNTSLLAIGLVVIGISLLVILKALLDLKTNFAVAPEPHSSASLITSGIYSKIRHPIYLAVISTSLGYLLIRFTFLMLGTFLIIVLFFIVKIHFEDRFLTERYGEYTQYRNRTKALIPHLW